jgi:hypothetical protein
MTTLERTLAKTLTEVVIRLDLSRDDVIAPGGRDGGAPAGDRTPARPPEQDRRARAKLINQFAQEKPTPRAAGGLGNARNPGSPSRRALHIKTPLGASNGVFSRGSWTLRRRHWRNGRETPTQSYDVQKQAC